MTRRFRLVAVAVLALYACALGVLFFSQRSLLYPASDRRTAVAEAGLVGFQDLVLTTSDGERLVAWWKPPESGKALILYFHGNGGSLWNRRLRAQALTASGRGLLMISYRGYSSSTGTPTEAGLHTDARTAYDWVMQAYAASRVVAYGESLGTGVAVRLASERMKAPILILHGTDDRIIPFAFGERLYTAAPEPKRFIRIEGGSHTRNLEQGGMQAVEEFLAAVEAHLLDQSSSSAVTPPQAP